ncbi:MAG TPA: tetratricopeptide repeat-containing protein [Steroidobacteraceae bacterium]|nr:tetratricopeptide repeat-containing protein [Steroidobacteraceae bacterium]
MTQKTCFVVMGFGKKTDYQSQRTLDLDKTYRSIIKRAVEAAGLTCIRADDVMHAGIIDKPMYELLLGADLVVADLSTSNANALYELGVRHALKPNTTIVIAESGFKFPFDLKSLLIRPYTHLGDGIDYEEVERMFVAVRDAAIALVGKGDVDSPVYTFLHELEPPGLRAKAQAAAAAVLETKDDHSAALLAEATAARDRGEFPKAKMFLETLLTRRPNDAFLIQQLALCTYKAKATPEQALAQLEEAREILKPLQPRATLDTETLGLWGAIHKRLWDARGQRPDLDEALWGYERGYYLRADYYNGINYAFLLNQRAAVSARADAIADFVIAQRVRRNVIDICQAIEQKIDPNVGGLKDDAGNLDVKATFWMLATLVEGYVGIGDEVRARGYADKAAALNPPGWMLDSLQDQLGKLRPMLVAQATLTNF